MTKHDRKLSELPYANLIIDNGTLTLRSIFDFTGGNEELFSFLYGCKARNCTVIFDNEGITVNPGDHDGTLLQDIMLSFYAMIAKEPKIAEDYIRYLEKLSFYGGEVKRKPMVQGIHEPILKEE